MILQERKDNMLKLVKLEEKYKKQLFEMMDEWSNSGEKIFKNYIKINNENLSAKQVATIIKEKFDL